MRRNPLLLSVIDDDYFEYYWQKDEGIKRLSLLYMLNYGMLWWIMPLVHDQLNVYGAFMHDIEF